MAKWMVWLAVAIGVLVLYHVRYGLGTLLPVKSNRLIQARHDWGTHYRLRAFLLASLLPDIFPGVDLGFAVTSEGMDAECTELAGGGNPVLSYIKTAQIPELAGVPIPDYIKR